MPRDNGHVIERSHLTRSMKERKAYNESWDRIFGKKQPNKSKPKQLLANNGNTYYTDEYVHWLESHLTETQLKNWDK